MSPNLKTPFERVAILGVGLLGGSVALAAKKHGLAKHVGGCGRRQAPLQAALARGVLDEVADVASACRDADLVLLATPLASMAAVLEAAAPELGPKTIVTDVGSVKGPVAGTLPKLLPAGTTFIGSHPMAGSHLNGVEHAEADLFEGACCVITPGSGASPEAVERLRGFWEGIGAKVLERSPEAHDDHAAWISHLPHALAFAFIHALRETPPAAGEMIGSGFRDFTRIARSDAALWGDILSANRKSLAAPLEKFGQSLSALARALEEGDANKVEQFLASASDGLTRVESGSADD
ncbi:MAG: prephenate dehydrogenase [Proteobacteria bacterium]|nr:prephenate dehydrogenase [Pseudomonadota bacterium]